MSRVLGKESAVTNPVADLHYRQHPQAAAASAPTPSAEQFSKQIDAARRQSSALREAETEQPADIAASEDKSAEPGFTADEVQYQLDRRVLAGLAIAGVPTDLIASLEGRQLWGRDIRNWRLANHGKPSRTYHNADRPWMLSFSPEQ